MPTDIIKQVEASNRTDLEKLHVLYYRTGMNPRPQEMNFIYQGDFKSACAFAKDYCDKLNFRFVIVKKFLNDLNADLKKFHTNEE